MAEINKRAFLPSSVSTIGSTARKKNQDVRRGQVTFVSPMTATGSPSFRTPTGGLGMSDVSEVPLNDDEAERRQRRRDNHMRSVMSPGCHTPRSAVRNPERLIQTDLYIYIIVNNNNYCRYQHVKQRHQTTYSHGTLSYCTM